MASARSVAARKAFAANVRRLRVEHGLTQERLADLTGLHRTYIGSVERAERNVSIDNMARIAKALKVSLAALVEQTD